MRATPPKGWSTTGTPWQLSSQLSIWSNPLIRWAAVVVGLAIAVIVITVPMGLWQQLTFAIITFGIAYWINKFEGQLTSIVLVLISGVVTARYIFWRVTETMGWFGISEYDLSTFDRILGLGLFLAEAYAWIVLYFGFVQTIWPLNRPFKQLPKDTSLWPKVDVFVPSYNEPLDVVRATVLGAKNLDYPPDKFSVWFLDDGCRPEMKEFCDEVGIKYIDRVESTHAKAGNINRAMTYTDGDYVAIFDCDHTPARSFLQVTVGWFLADKGLGMLQTPHHFFSPDPFERNLGVFKVMPTENELFYGLLQDGNDFWNATFFCGSCAVLNKKALAEVGGVAVETVTEDAHTALKMHRKGWRTAYVNIPQAAGLATETLSAHVGQRIRWARGMVQIFRVDNPFLVSGLNFFQRMCYANGMMHFLYSIPRIVFLTAPLGYLLMDAKVIQASAEMIAVYAIPHLFHANHTNSRIQGKHRRSIWAEVYETTLATYILMPTLLALINPKLGSFNVTEKGGIQDEEIFDNNIAKPYLYIFGALTIGLIFGLYRLIVFDAETAATPGEFGTILMNMFWAVYSLIIVGATMSVAWEKKQVRRTIRVDRNFDAGLRLQNGKILTGKSHDLSEGGGAIALDKADHGIAQGDSVELILRDDIMEYAFPCKVAVVRPKYIGLAFDNLSMDDVEKLVHFLFLRADSWMDWLDNQKPDNPIVALGEVAAYGFSGGYKFLKWFGAQTWEAIVSRLKNTTSRTIIILFLMVVFAAIFLVPKDSMAAPTDGKTVRLTFEELGVQDPMRLIGVDGRRGIPFAVRSDQLVTQANLRLIYAYSPSLIGRLSQLNIFINGEVVKTIRLNYENRRAEGILDVPINPLFISDYNQLEIQFVGHYREECEDPLYSSLWAVISNKSHLELTYKPVILEDSIDILPLPFFDERDNTRLELPFVFGEPPTLPTLRAAGIVSSWFGAMADYRKAEFPVSYGEIPADNAVFMVTRPEAFPSLRLPAISGPTISVVRNPRNKYAKLLLVMGRNDEELVIASKALAFGHFSLSGSSEVVRAYQDEARRRPYDAPRWLPSHREVKFGELTDESKLQAFGFFPDLIRLDYRVPPDLFLWRQPGLDMELEYRHTARILGNRSALNISVNDKFIKGVALGGDGPGVTLSNLQLPLLPEEEVMSNEGVRVPLYHLGESNQLQFHFQYNYVKAPGCTDVHVDSMRSAIDADSTIDISSYPHFMKMPDLNAFAYTGFPYTRLADLSETTVVMPIKPAPAEVEAYLVLMGMFGESTGYPGGRMQLAHANNVGVGEDTDLLIIGSTRNQPLLSAWAEYMPMYFSRGTWHVRVPSPYERIKARWDEVDLDETTRVAGRMILSAGERLAAVMAFQSPLNSSRSAVVLASSGPEHLRYVTDALLDNGKLPFVRGDMVVINGDRVSPFTVGPDYYVGKLPFWTWLRWVLSKQPLSLVIGLFLVAALVAGMLAYVLKKMADKRLNASGEKGS